MKYFSPNYWFKLWLLSAPLFNDEIKGINAKSINNNEKIKNWASKNISSLDIINENINYENLTNQPYSLLNQSNQNYLDLQNYENNLTLIENKLEYENKSIKRDKREFNLLITRRILQLNENLIINFTNPRQYIESTARILQSLIRENILRPVINVGNEADDNIIYTINLEQQYGYFRLPVQIYNNNEQRNLDLVFRTDNLYMQGFIVNNNYYHFNFNNVNMRFQPRAVRDGSVPLLTEIEGMSSSNTLNRISPDYRDILPTENNEFNRNNLFNSFWNLTENIDINSEARGEFAQSLGRVIFVTSEALRFRNIYNIISNNIIRENRNLNINFRDNNIYQILVSWGPESRQYRSFLFGEDNLYRGWEVYFRYGLDLFLHSITENQFIDDLTPIDFITQLLQNNNVRVLLGAIFPVLFAKITKKCNNKKRDINNPFWKEKFCEIKNEEEKIKGKLKIVQILDENTKGNLKSGDIFIGTTNGVYLIKSNPELVYKADNINDDEVTSIKNFARDKFYAATKNGDVYFLRTDRIASDGHLIGEILPNLQSSDLNKELKLYYEPAPKDDRIETNSRNSGNVARKITLWTLNLAKINPIDNYEKIEFLGDINNEWATSTLWGSDTYHDEKDLYSCLDDRRFDNFILNKKADNNINQEESVTKCVLQNREYSSGAASMSSKQRFGLTWYWENHNYYLQSVFFQYTETWSSFSYSYAWMKTGNGIRLYNDNDNLIKLNKNFGKEKELNLFFNKDNSSFISKCDFKWESKNKCCELKTINLEKNNPLDYQKIKFFDVNEKIKSNWGGKDYLFKEVNEYDFMKNKNIEDIIVNTKVNDNTDEIFDKTKLLLEEKNDSSGFAGVSFDQKLGLTWYWENNNYYLQTLICQRGESFWLGSGGTLSADLGKGIKLYNDNVNTNSRKKREINNKDEWNNDFSKSINNEQNLPIINNTNFVKNNLTSL